MNFVFIKMIKFRITEKLEAICGFILIKHIIL